MNRHRCRAGGKMFFDSGHNVRSRRRARLRAVRRPGRYLRLGAGLTSGVVASRALAPGSSSNAATGRTVTLNYYSFPDNSGAIQQAVTNCGAQSGGKYVISYNKPPTSADGQRQQLVRRLAAGDTSMDILGLDVTWEAEFAQAGWILPWTGTYQQQASNDTLKVPLETATWQGKLYAVPYNSNTQLLWYRSDLVPNPPQTWDEMIKDANDLAQQGKPHLIEIQGAQHEGVVGWCSSLLRSAA